MTSINPVILIPIVVVAIILFRMEAGRRDHERIRRYINSRGGRVIGCQWTIAARGWFFEKGERFYEVTYADAEGNLHRATCKTSTWTGVYFTDDLIYSHAHPLPEPGEEEIPAGSSSSAGRREAELQEVADLRAENDRLREENARLKEELAKGTQ